MATELKPPDHPTRAELRAYLEHVEQNKLVKSLGYATRDGEVLVKVHSWLWRVAAGEPRRKAA